MLVKQWTCYVLHFATFLLMQSNLWSAKKYPPRLLEAQHNNSNIGVGRVVTDKYSPRNE